MIVLGLSFHYHDAAAAIVRDGALIAAAQEERFSRVRHDPSFPHRAARFCLESAGVTARDIDAVAFYDRPITKFERILTGAAATFPRSLPTFLKAIPVWLKEKLWVPQMIREELGYDGEVYFTDHHVSHAASAFLVSPFREAAIITVDGVGEWDTATWGWGADNDIHLPARVAYPHSLGLLYSAFTTYLGFRVNSAEYKVMGLAPYGSPVYADLIADRIIRTAPDGSFRLATEYFAYPYGLRMTNGKFHRLFGRPPRGPDEPLEQFHKDVAASIQKVTNDTMLAIARHVRRETGMRALCMAGGVALNCVANEKILQESGFDELFVQPAAGDAGGALGSAFHVVNTLFREPRTFTMTHAYWGPAYGDDEIAGYLDAAGVRYRRLDEQRLLDEVAERIARQEVVGWFQGRMEWGPRALGNRSILADARNAENWSRVNLKVKFRESFRPFAPSVPLEDAERYFATKGPSPYMLLTAPVREGSDIPAVTHVDGSARIQTVSESENALYYRLLKSFGRLTGCPVLINTSFNVRGEPIVCSPHDALECFANTGMDVLVLGRHLVTRDDIAHPVIALTRDRTIAPD